MRKNRQLIVSLEKAPPTLEDQLKEPMPIEQKIEIVKDLTSWSAGLFVLCKIVDTCGKVAVAVAQAKLS